MVHCAEVKFCVYQTEICNNQTDCPRGEDEVSCHHFSCTAHCHCHNQAILCKKTQISEILNNLLSMKYVRFFQCNISHILVIAPILSNVISSIMTLDMSHNQLNNTCLDSSASFDSHLLSLNISYNQVPDIRFKCFHVFPRLTFIDLSRNQIIDLQDFSFYGLAKVLSLNLAHNKIFSIIGSIFSPLLSLEVLNIVGNPVKIVGSFFDNPHLRELSSDSFYPCCYIDDSKTKCSAKWSYMSSCRDLLSILPMKIFIMLNGLLALVLSALNTGVRLLPQYKKKHIDYNLMDISIIDGFLGLYLLIIGSADLYYSGRFAGNHFVWQKSIICVIATSLYIYFMVSSTLSLTFLAGVRFGSVKFPLFAKRLLFPKNPKILFYKIMLTSIFTILIIALYYIRFRIAPNSLCILIQFESSNSFLTVFTLFSSIYQILGFVSIAALYAELVRLVNTSSKTFNQKSKKRDFRSGAINLAVLSNMCSWLPSSVIFLVSLSGHKMSPAVMMWNIILIIPINSTLNGILFSVGTKEFRNAFRTSFANFLSSTDLFTERSTGSKGEMT